MPGGRKPRSLVGLVALGEHGPPLMGVWRYLISSVYAVAGYPSVTVPAGLKPTGEAIGLTYTGDYLDDAQVLAYAYAFEQASKLRQVPPADAVE